jgi:hypothetical protein
VAAAWNCAATARPRYFEWDHVAQHEHCSLAGRQELQGGDEAEGNRLLRVVP